jgi:hypothetical protein
MNTELVGLRNRRNDLTKELARLSEREEVLRTKACVLEKMLNTRESGGPKHPVKGQKGLATAEAFAEKRNWTENADSRTQPAIPNPRGNQLSRAGGSKFIRVRLKKNTIFSWNYTKLP